MDIQAIYQKLAPIAVSTLVSLLALAPQAVAADGKKALAQVPGMAPPTVPAPKVMPRGASLQRNQHRGSSPGTGGARRTPAPVIDYARLAGRSYPVSRLQRALYLKQQGHVDQALVEFLKCAQENPLQVQAYYEQALIFKQKGYNKLAQSSLQQALVVRPEFRDARVLLASLYLEDGDLSHATKELVRSLGLDLEKKPASPPGKATALPAPKANIEQTSHGRLPLAQASQTVPQAHPQSNIGTYTAAGTSTTGGVDAFGEAPNGLSSRADRPESRPVAAPAVPTADNQPAAGSFTVKELSTPQSADEELLKKILGISGPLPEPPPAAGAGPTDVRKVVNGGAAGGQSDNPLPVGAPGAKVISATNRDAQQLLDQIRTQKKNNSFSWFNPFSWFDKGQLGAAKPEAPPAQPQHQLVKQVEARAFKMSGPHKTRVAGWFDDVRDHLHKSTSAHGAHEGAPDLATLLQSPPPMPPAEAEPSANLDFNPVRTLSQKPSEPVHQPILRRVVSWLPLPIFKPLFQKPSSSIPQPKLLAASPAPPPSPLPAASSPRPARLQLPPQAARSWQAYMTTAPPVPSLPPQAGPVVLPAPPPQAANSHSNSPLAIEQFLKFLPRRVITNIEQAFAPKPVDVKADSGTLPPPQPAGIRHGAAPEPVPAPVAGLRGNVYENLVSARVSSSSQQEVANPLLRPAPPILFTSVHTSAQGGALQNPQFDPSVPSGPRNLGRVQETTLDAQMSRASGARPPAPSAVPINRAGNAPGRTFTKPALTAPRQYVVRGIEIPRSQLKTDPLISPDKAPAAPVDDKWTARMKYLLAHGTSSLSPREAFMYSEETGEGQLFLADRTIVRRQLAAKQAREDVLRLRRPDIYNSQGELRYSLSLLGKIIKPSETRKPPKTEQPTPPDASANSLFDESQGFFGWLKNMFKM